jgi:hypothetical protein
VGKLARRAPPDSIISPTFHTLLLLNNLAEVQVSETWETSHKAALKDSNFF